ncbi:MAG: sigma-70 family RNA polymerase sigma factor [Acidimicrobiia bacterium]|nr:sigma-70 family RNA polymerase sigma factor [Acidimicrobiia bacterium]MBT8192476.1 sigma-70 family RNA polymerase sigma factor [Acidimicrobiia bacterium]MBT8246937.1 sigma-70 family RNA polymerase sigma factor [Acidimicrobiia bacterium]NNJ47961.1 sigma-70 family RNA polymerase sigma factor [Acidimicrobiia bacterium]NNL14503.1 sigma-70 family RNA polymerase sigma factor [Acidimicrobiia bacterium]
MDTSGQFRALYEEHQPQVLAYFLRRLSRDDAVEATADVFLTAWRRMDDAPPEPEAKLWLFGIARNVLRNRQRSGRRRHRLVSRIATAPIPTAESAEAVAIGQLRDGELVTALNQLRRTDREIVLLRLWEGASYPEIAALLGCSRHAAEQRYAKALRRLRSAFPRTGHAGVTHPTGHVQEQSHES